MTVLGGSAGAFAPPMAVGTAPAPPRTPSGTHARQRLAPELRLGARVTLPDLVGHADLIVAGEVVDLKPSWNAERSDIFTTVVLRIDRPLKGSAGGEVRFRTPGGAVGDDWVWVTHAPRFEIGERALVFLRFHGPRLPTVVGMEAGKRRVVTDDDGRDRILPELRWEDARKGAPLVLTTIGELADALPRVEAQGPEPGRD